MDNKELILYVAFTLYCDNVMFDKDITIDELDFKSIKKNFNNLLEYINTEHHGDCTNISGPCARCIAEQYIRDAKLIISNYKNN